jgi:hypothetical protein
MHADDHGFLLPIRAVEPKKSVGPGMAEEDAGLTGSPEEGTGGGETWNIGRRVGG